MPLFSDHINNMYYSGVGYSSVPYSYSSSTSPIGSSYSASYLNPGGHYSTHSSIGGYSRTPLTTRWMPSTGRSYSPALSTISERATSSPSRINSPRRVPISTRNYITSSNYIPRPKYINTADIDVSKDKYQHKPEMSMTENENSVDTNSPFMPRVDSKPDTGVDSSPGNPRSTIKRGRTVVRIHTIKRKEKDSPRKPLDKLESDGKQSIKSEQNENFDTSCLGWRERLSDDLIYKDKKEKKTLGAKLVEKFLVKTDKIDETEITKPLIEDCNTQQTIPLKKLAERRCSMELLAEQAVVLDSLIRKENLDTVSLDLSKIGVNENISLEKCQQNLNINQPRNTSSTRKNSLLKTRSDQSLHNRLTSRNKSNIDTKHLSKRKTLKKSSSGGNIGRLDSITEIPKELPLIEEIKQPKKLEKPELKTKLKQKITSSVEIVSSFNPLKVRVENITVEEKPIERKKEIFYTSHINQISNDESASPETDDGNFWSKIGSRESVYLTKRKQNLDEVRERQRKALFWFPEENEFNVTSEIENKVLSLDEEIKKEKEYINNITEVEGVPDASNSLSKITADKVLKQSNFTEENNNKEAKTTVTQLLQENIKEKETTQIILPSENMKRTYLDQENNKAVSKEPNKSSVIIENVTNEILDTDIPFHKCEIQSVQITKVNHFKYCEILLPTPLTPIISNMEIDQIIAKQPHLHLENQDFETQLQELTIPDHEISTTTSNNISNEILNLTESCNILQSKTNTIVETSIKIVEEPEYKDESEKMPLSDEETLPVTKLPVFSRKPIKDEPALRPLIATPRPLQKKVHKEIRSYSSSEPSSEESSDDDTSSSENSEDSVDFFECENNVDGRTSTGSNDSGFDSSAPNSPAGFVHVKKDCDVNCHRKCEKLTANLCGVNQRLLVEALSSKNASRKGAESAGTSTTNVSTHSTWINVTDVMEKDLEQSTAYGLFRKTGRFTPPAKSIPRFRKYTVEDFHFIKVLGKGSFGKVLLAELRDTEYYYAVKCLKKDVVLEDDDVECTLIERKVLALGTNHPYLCHLFATFQSDSHLFFVMEYLNGGDLMFHIQQSGRFPESRGRFYAAEIVSGLKFLHKRGIIYRDLKLDNILLDFDGHVRIADFGMCKLQIYLDKTADTFCGTPDYMAPEIIKGLKYNQAVDWWSFGVLLYEMLIGQSPFSGCDEDELFWSICNEMPSYPRFLSQDAHTILTRLLDKDARTRLGGVECIHGDVREQDFFRQILWDKLERKELDAPFKPRVRHPLDTQYFDKAFTGERPRLTAVEPHVLRSMDQEPFRGFSYTNPNATDR